MYLKLDRHLLNECHIAASAVADQMGQFIVGKTTTGIERATDRIMEVGIDQLAQIRRERDEFRAQFPEWEHPCRYVLTASGSVDDDIDHSLAAAQAGAHIIASIRSTAQSHLDFVPEGDGPDDEWRSHGQGGTYTTQQNMRIIREVLDKFSEENFRYVGLSDFSSGLCMAEIAALGAIEGLDNMVADAMYGILYRDINMQRTLIDQHFARMICGWAGMTINTGEDNYFRTSDQMQTAHTGIASNFINYHLAHASGISAEHIGLGGAFEVDPKQENSLAYEIAHALLLRECFQRCPTKYMPPTKHMNGNFFRTHASDTLFNLTCGLTQQGIMTVGVPDEGRHTPHIHSRVYALQGVEYTLNASKVLGGEFELRSDGLIVRHAHSVLCNAATLLSGVAETGLFKAIEDGVFGDVKRFFDGGKGLDGVMDKPADYHNPVEAAMLRR